MAPHRQDSSVSTTGGPAAPTFSFSSDRLAVRDRLDFFKGELSKLLALDVEPLDARPRQIMQVTAAGPVAFSEIQFSPMRLARRSDRLRDCDEDFVFTLAVAGRANLTYVDQEITLDPGHACLTQNSRPGSGTFPDGGSIIVARIDRTALRPLVRCPEEMTGVSIDHTRPGLELLRGYLRTFQSVKGTLTPTLAHSFGHHVVDLIAAVLGPTRDGAAQAEAGGIRAARLQQVLDAIASRACDPAFTVETIAGELGVSSRYIQKLLEVTGATFSEHVIERRLLRARHLLASGHGRSKVAEAAFDAGFNDVAHFHRAFRRRFGMTPAAVRGTASPT